MQLINQLINNAINLPGRARYQIVPGTISCQVPDRARYLIVPGTWSIANTPTWKTHPTKSSISYVFCDSTPSFNGTCLEWYLARSGTWHDQVPGTIWCRSSTWWPDTRSCQVPDLPGRARYQIVPGTWSCQVPDRVQNKNNLWHRPINYWITVIWGTKIGICGSGTCLIDCAPAWHSFCR